MILLSHMLVGAAIGSKIHNFWAIFFIGIVLHYAFDALPHWEYYFRSRANSITKKNLLIYAAKIAIDLLVGVFLVLFFAKNSSYWSFIVFGAFSSILPDGLIFLHDGLKKIFGYDSQILRKLHQFHHGFHISKTRNSPFWGIVIEGSAVILAIYLLLT